METIRKQHHVDLSFSLLAKIDYEQIELQCLVVVHPLVGQPTEDG